MSIKSYARRLRLRAFLMSSVFSLNAEHGRCHDRAKKLLEKRRMKFEDHSGHHYASAWVRKDRWTGLLTDRAPVVFAQRKRYTVAHQSNRHEIYSRDFYTN